MPNITGSEPVFLFVLTVKGLAVERDHRISGAIDKNMKLTLYISVIFSLFFSLLVPILNNGNEFRIIAAIGLSVFVIFHGIHRYGWQKMSIFMGITFIISLATETLSISTGFPFGNYYYTELLGIKVGTVPWGIMLAYFFTGYLAWTIGGVFLNETSAGIKKKNLILVPVISAFFMVLWNLSFDPVMSTIEGNWIWVAGRGVMGVPFTNYFGWFLTTYISYQIFALVLYNTKSNEAVTQKKWYWILVPVMFIIQGIEYLIHPFLRNEHMEIYRAVFFITFFGIVFVSLLCILYIMKKET